MKYYFTATTVAWALLTIALPIVGEQAFLNTTTPADTALIIALGGSTWLLLAHETRRGLGSPGAFLSTTAALWGLAFWMTLDSLSWGNNVPWGVGMLRFLNLAVFVPVSVLMLALGLQWPPLLPLTPLALTVPLVLLLFFEKPVWLLGIIVILFLVNLASSKSFSSITSRNVITLRIINAFQNLDLAKSLSAIGAVVIFVFMFSLVINSLFANVGSEKRLNYVISSIIAPIMIMSPLTFTTGLGLQILLASKK